MKIQSLLQKSTGKKHNGATVESEVRPLHKPVRYMLKHLGAMPVDEETPSKRYRDGIGASAVRTIVVMAKSAHKKGVEVHLEVAPDRIRVRECGSQKMLVDSPIQRVCFCTSDGVYNKVFAFIYRVPEKEVMECHAFYCGAPQVAQAMALAMNSAFHTALDRENRAEQQLRDAHVTPINFPVYPLQHSRAPDASTSSACSSAMSTQSHPYAFEHTNSVDSGALTSLRSGTTSPCEGDSASLHSTRSVNYSADSATGEQLPAIVELDMQHDFFAPTAKSAPWRGGEHKQLHAAEVHAPRSVAECVPIAGCALKCWSSSDDVTVDGATPTANDRVLPLWCATNYSCVLPVIGARD